MYAGLKHGRQADPCVVRRAGPDGSVQNEAAVGEGREEKRNVFGDKGCEAEDMGNNR